MCKPMNSFKEASVSKIKSRSHLFPKGFPKTSSKQPPIQIPIDKSNDLMPKNPDAADHSFYVERQSW